jgi:hypothetical protein
MRKTTITCDVIGCKEEGYKSVECCRGWVIDDDIKYKKFEKPTEPELTDLCLKHFKEWSKLTCKLLKMDKELK